MLQPYLFSLLPLSTKVLRAPGVVYRATFFIYHKTTLPIFLLLGRLATAIPSLIPAMGAHARHL